MLGLVRVLFVQIFGLLPTPAALAGDAAVGARARSGHPLARALR